MLKMNVSFIEHLLCGVWSIPGRRQGQVRRWSQPGKRGREARMWGQGEVHVEDVIADLILFLMGQESDMGPRGRGASFHLSCLQIGRV